MILKEKGYEERVQKTGTDQLVSLGVSLNNSNRHILGNMAYSYSIMQIKDYLPYKSKAQEWSIT